MASGVGSLEWARRTHGRLSARDRATLILQGARRQARSLLPRDAILARHPRHDMKKRFVAVMDDELVRHPDSRPAFFTRRLGFRAMIERAPFDD